MPFSLLDRHPFPVPDVIYFLREKLKQRTREMLSKSWLEMSTGLMALAGVPWTQMAQRTWLCSLEQGSLVRVRLVVEGRVGLGYNISSLPLHDCKRKRKRKTMWCAERRVCVSVQKARKQKRKPPNLLYPAKPINAGIVRFSFLKSAHVSPKRKRFKGARALNPHDRPHSASH